MSAIVEAPCVYKSAFRTTHPCEIPFIEELNPLKQVQTGIAPTRRQKIIANRRKNFQLKKKTELCKNFMLGEICPLGEKCSFAHGTEELKPRHNSSATFKTIKCKHYHTQMFCQYGPRCQFLHKDSKGEVKAIKMSYTQLFSMMGDSFLVDESRGKDCGIEEFLQSHLNLKANCLKPLAVFEALKN